VGAQRRRCRARTSMPQHPHTVILRFFDQRRSPADLEASGSQNIVKRPNSFYSLWLVLAIRAGCALLVNVKRAHGFERENAATNAQRRSTGKLPNGVQMANMGRIVGLGEIRNENALTGPSRSGKAQNPASSVLV